MHGRAGLDLLARLLDGGADLVTGTHPLEPHGQSLDGQAICRFVMGLSVVGRHGVALWLPQARSLECGPFRGSWRPALGWAHGGR